MRFLPRWHKKVRIDTGSVQKYGCVCPFSPSCPNHTGPRRILPA